MIVNYTESGWQICDAFSLLICQGLVQPEGRKIEISKGPDGRAYEMHTSGEGLIVEPWPFDADSIVVSWESRTLSQLSFNHVGEFRNAVTEAIPVSHQLRLFKSS